MHDVFEQTANAVPTNRCFGRRAYDPGTKTFGAYEWEDYRTIAERRANLGAGLVKLHRDVGITENKFGVGIWSQNRPEWQINGMRMRLASGECY